MGVTCNRCGSASFTSEKRGFNATKGVIGAATFGILGALWGTKGSSERDLFCNDCGNKIKITTPEVYSPHKERKDFIKIGDDHLIDGYGQWSIKKTLIVFSIVIFGFLLFIFLV